MKSHITPDGPKKCVASVQECEYATAEGEPTNHFDTIAEARDVYAARLKASHDELATIKSDFNAKDHARKKRENALLDKNYKMAQELVALRAAVGKITFDDANEERAKRRLEEAVNFAESRHNTHLIEKLTKAKVLPSGAFKMEDGTRVNTDNQLKSTVALKHIDAERGKLMSALKDAIDGDVTEGKHQWKDENGTFSLTVSKGFDEEAFAALPDHVRTKCEELTDVYTVEAVRDYFNDLSEEDNPTGLKYEDYVNETQVIDYVVGKTPNVGQDNMKASTVFEGNNADEKIQSGLKNVGKFYGDVRTSLRESNPSSTGRVSDLKSIKAGGDNAIKSAAAVYGGNAFVPARSQFNGAVVSQRYAVNKKALDELPVQHRGAMVRLKSIPSPDEARKVMSPESFDRIFNATKVSLRVTEAK